MSNSYFTHYINGGMDECVLKDPNVYDQCDIIIMHDYVT